MKHEYEDGRAEPSSSYSRFIWTCTCRLDVAARLRLRHTNLQVQDKEVNVEGQRGLRPCSVPIHLNLFILVIGWWAGPWAHCPPTITSTCRSRSSWGGQGRRHLSPPTSTTTWNLGLCGGERPSAVLSTTNNPKFTLVADGDGGRRPCRLHLRLKCCIKISIGGREAEGLARPPILF